LEQIELNKKLLDECCKKKIDIKKIKELISQGAELLGQISDKWPDNLYGEIVCDNENLYEITKIFIESGMVIKHSMFKNDDDSIDPLWELAFCCNEEGIKTLKLLLDNNLDFDSVEEFIDHVYIDYLFLEIPDTDDDKLNLSFFEYAMKMLMLCASYKYVYEKSEYLRRIIEVENNSYDINKFRDYNNFYVKVEKNKFYFIEKENKIKVWEIKF